MSENACKQDVFGQIVVDDKRFRTLFSAVSMAYFRVFPAFYYPIFCRFPALSAFLVGFQQGKAGGNQPLNKTLTIPGYQGYSNIYPIYIYIVYIYIYIANFRKPVFCEVRFSLIIQPVTPGIRAFQGSCIKHEVPKNDYAACLWQLVRFMHGLYCILYINILPIHHNILGLYNYIGMDQNKPIK